MDNLKVLKSIKGSMKVQFIVDGEVQKQKYKVFQNNDNEYYFNAFGIRYSLDNFIGINEL